MLCLAASLYRAACRLTTLTSPPSTNDCFPVANRDYRLICEKFSDIDKCCELTANYGNSFTSLDNTELHLSWFTVNSFLTLNRSFYLAGLRGPFFSMSLTISVMIRLVSVFSLFLLWKLPRILRFEECISWIDLPHACTLRLLFLTKSSHV